MTLRGLLIVLFLSSSLFGRARVSGYCDQGGQVVVTAAQQSTTKVQQSYPSCSITALYTGGAQGIVSTSGSSVTWESGTPFNSNSGWSGLTMTINSVPYTIMACSSSVSCTLTSSAGTQNNVAYSMPPTAPAAIFSNNSGTVLSNPFSASKTGYWFFYADNGEYDIGATGGGIPSPITWGSIPVFEPLTAFVSDFSPPNSLATTCARAATMNATLVLSIKWVNLSTQTLPCNILGAGGLIGPGSAQTITMTGSILSSQQVFEVSNGSISLAQPQVTVLLEWFGVDVTGATDNTSIYAKAFSALPANGGSVSIPSGTLAGLFVLPAYPKTITMHGQGELATTLIPFVTNTQVFTAAATTPNFVSGNHVIGGFSIMAHASGSTGAAIEWKTLQRTTWEHITFLSNTNGTGNFAVGIVCDDGGGDGVHQCYANVADYITDTVQSGPTTLVDVKGASSSNHFAHFTVTSNNTGLATVFLFENSGNNMNTVEDSLIEGNLVATAIIPGAKNIFKNIYFEGNLADITGNGGGLDSFTNISITGSTVKVTCPNGESGWLFQNSPGTGPTGAVLNTAGCVNYLIQEGGVMFNAIDGARAGGITTSLVSAPGMTTFTIPNQSVGLAAGTYHYAITSRNGGGESTAGTKDVTISSGQAPAQVTFIPSNNINGAAQFVVYGRNCNTTCGFLFAIDNVGSNAVGTQPFDDGTFTPTAQVPPTRNSSGDLNSGALIHSIQGYNFLALETGANNALVVSDPLIGGSFPYPTGFTIDVLLAHSLTNGANTLNLNGNVDQIASFSTGLGHTIATAISAGTVQTFKYINAGMSHGWLLMGIQ